MKLKTILSVLVIVALFMPNALAADLSVMPRDTGSEIEAGQEFTVDIVLDTKGENLNSVEGKITFSDDQLDVVKIDLQDSVVNFWFQQPTSAVLSFSGIEERFAEIAFSGLILGGLATDGAKIFSVTFKDKAVGEGMVEFLDTRVLLNDGEGTLAEVNIKNYAYDVVGSGFVGGLMEEGSEDGESESTEEESTDGPDEDAGTQMSYDEEKDVVFREEIITKYLEASSNKCEFIVMNGRAAGWVIDEEKVRSEYFNDVNEAGLDWCVPYVDYAFEHSIVKGRAEEEFGVEGYVSRYEVAVMLARQLTDELRGDEVTSFTDDFKFPYWARGSIAYLSEHGIFKGYTMNDGTMMFGGDESIVKVDAAIVLYRTFYLLDDSDIF